MHGQVQQALTLGTGSFLRALFQDQAVLDGLRQALQEAVLHQVVGQEVHQVGVPLTFRRGSGRHRPPVGDTEGKSVPELCLQHSDVATRKRPKHWERFPLP